jgi:hypothetical protein
MKQIAYVLLMIFVCTLFSSAQTPNRYQFGDRTIFIPSPDGFANVIGRFPKVTARFNATEDPANIALASHVPESFLPDLEASESIDLEFYTKVSTSRRLRTIPVTLENYKAVVNDLEKNFDTYLDPDGDLIRKVETNSEKGLAGIGTKATIRTTSTKNLGFFEKNERVFSAMSEYSANVSGRMVTTLGTLSVVRVKDRLLFVYVYRMFPDEYAAKDLVTFTRTYTAKILAANK